MAEKETRNEPKEIIEITPEEIENAVETENVSKERETIQETEEEHKLNSWVPKTKLGKLVKQGKEKDIDKILKEGKKIIEPEILDTLLKLSSDLILIGQAKGKFGGGKRRAWRQTQKKTKEGNVLSFSAMAVVGDENGHIGVGMGKARETLPSREKALRDAKLNLIRIKRGFESPEAEKDKTEPHTVPFKVEGKCGSVRITLLPAPRGTGLVVNDECKKILKLAGIKDVYSMTRGKTKTTFNLARACVNALEKTRGDEK
ncbi:30S ribosomal protein S5 [Candidatus Pacearchaeota archaeon]|nr:30S ribosomal protein S5 [Candidatus Pacearchaeota archaeon]